jgi:hypothetical protein
VAPDHIGECIYCGQAESLSDEHVVPLGLNGNFVLRAASCETCRQITSRFETALLRGGFRSAREALQYRTRSRNRPRTLPVFGLPDVKGGRKELDLADYPVTLIMPRPAGPVLDQFSQSLAQEMLPWAYTRADFELLSTKHDIREFASNSLDTHAFYRTLAKIAHGSAVKFIGLGNFVPFLQKPILDGTFTDFKHFIGTLAIETGKFEEPGFEVEVGWASVEDREYVECRIRLFPELNTPWYRVIAGANIDSLTAIARGQSTLASQSPNDCAPWRLHVKGTKKDER